MDTTYRLRVVKFNDEDLRENKVDTKNERDVFNKGVNCNLSSPKNGERVQTVSAIQPIKRTKKYKDVKNIIYRSSSELLKNNILRSIYSKAWSIDDIRKAIKKNIHTNTSRQYCPKRRLNSYDIKKPNCVWCKSHGDSQNDIEVILPFRPKIHRTRREISPIIKNDYYIKKTSSDLFGTKSSTCKSTYLCYQTCRNIGLHPLPKKRKNQAESKIHVLHRCCPLKRLKSQHKKLRFKSEPEIPHFSLVNFPIHSKYNQPHYVISSENLSNGDKPPLILNYNENIDLNELKMEPAIYPKVSSRSLEKPYGKEYCFTDKTQENSFLHRFLYILKCLAITILNVVAVLLWLPCIIIASIVWVIIFSFWPIKKNLEDEPCATKCARNIIVCSKQWGINNFRRFCWQVRRGNNDVEITTQSQHHRPSIPAMPCQVITARNKKRKQKWQPNPTKRYVLYYDCNRGWLMKPERHRVETTCRADVGSMKGKKVTFFDSASCTFKHTQQNKSVRECTQATCRDPMTKAATCVKCTDVDLKERKKETTSIDHHIIHNTNVKPQTKKRQDLVPSKESLKLQKLNKTKQKEIVVKRLSHKPVTHWCLCGATGHRRGGGGTKKLNLGKRICNCLKSCGREIWDGKKRAEKETWGNGIQQCGDLFWLTIKNKPCFWIRSLGDGVYFRFLCCHRHCMRVCRCCLFICAACVWCPIFVCAYLCYQFVCLFCGNDCGCC